jgi:hypothetical protein
MYIIIAQSAPMTSKRDNFRDNCLILCEVLDFVLAISFWELLMTVGRPGGLSFLAFSQISRNELKRGQINLRDEYANAFRLTVKMAMKNWERRSGGHFHLGKILVSVHVGFM